MFLASNLNARFDAKSYSEDGLLIQFSTESIFGNQYPVFRAHFVVVNRFSFPHDSNSVLLPGKTEGLFIAGNWAHNLPVGEIEYMAHSVGKDSYLRTVYTLDIPKEINLRAGLTVHEGRGTWSSYPMHTFEEGALISPASSYPDFRELFAVVTDPPHGWGIQVVSSREERIVRPFVDRDILDIPISFHPVVGEPKTRIAYFWAYTSGGEKFTAEGRV